MMKRIMKIGVTAVALAASALLATPATAQPGNRADLGVSAAELRGGAGDFRRGRGDRTVFRGRRQNDKGRNIHHQVFLNEYGQTPKEVRYLIKDAIYACSCQLEIDARKYGYKDAGFRRTPHVEQIGPRRFIVKGRAKLFDGYDYSRQPYDCVVRKGKIRRASALYPVRQAKHFNPRRNRGFGFGHWQRTFGGGW